MQCLVADIVGSLIHRSIDTVV